MKSYVIIDNGHGEDTAGKCSPDGRYCEWEWTRQAARRLMIELKGRGMHTQLLVPEEYDVDLRARCRRANEIYRYHPEAVLVSLHSNASGDGLVWGTPSGWSAWVAPEASRAARRLAGLLFVEASARKLLGNRHTPLCGYWERRLYLCRNTLCPTVLTENMFHDNRADVDFLMSEAGLDAIVQLHADALEKYYVSFGPVLADGVAPGAHD